MVGNLSSIIRGSGTTRLTFYTMTSIVIGKSLATSESSNSSDTPFNNYQILLVDFGKARKVDQGKFLHLNAIEQDKYRMKFPHIAPEGDSKQTIFSDMFSVGAILYQVAESEQLFLASTKRNG